MNRMAIAGLGVLVVGATLAPGSLAAQAALGTDCQLRQDYREFATRQVSPGNRITYVGGPYLICPEGLRIQADSAVVYESSGRTELIGRVRFRHPERELDAELADYYEREGRLYARGQVRFLDVEGGTEIEGDTLDFREATSSRPEEQLTVWGERSWATLVPASSGPEGAAAPDDPEGAEPTPYRVGADRLRFEGEDYFWGDGNVEVERDDLRATSDSLAFDQPGGQLILTGDAYVERGEVVATGGIVNLGIRDDLLESLRTRREGRIETDDGTILTGDDVLVRLTPTEEIESVTAQGTPDVRATLEAEGILFLGETVVIEGAQAETRIIRATGSARGETDTDAPAITLEAEEGESGLRIERNWLEGNEITATFERVDDAGSDAPEPTDPDAPDVPDPDAGGALDASPSNDQYELLRLESSGSAKTLYRQPPDQDESDEEAGDEDDDPDPPADAAGAGDDPDVEPEAGAPPETGPGSGDARLWSISYILADRIVIHMLDGEVERVEAEGNQVDGIQLDPADGGSSSDAEQETSTGPGR